MLIHDLCMYLHMYVHTHSTSECVILLWLDCQGLLRMNSMNTVGPPPISRPLSQSSYNNMYVLWVQMYSQAAIISIMQQSSYHGNKVGNPERCT